MMETLSEALGDVCLNRGKETKWHGQETGELSVRAPNTCIPSSLEVTVLQQQSPFFT